MIRKFWLHGTTGFFVAGEISSYAVVVLSIATAWALVRVWLRVNQYMASYFTSSGDTSARCAVIWVRFPFDVISKQPAVEHKIGALPEVRANIMISWPPQVIETVLGRSRLKTC